MAAAVTTTAAASYPLQAPSPPGTKSTATRHPPPLPPPLSSLANHPGRNDIFNNPSKMTSPTASTGPTSPPPWSNVSYSKEAYEPIFYDLTGNPTSPPSSPRGRITPLLPSSPSSPTKRPQVQKRAGKPTPPPSRRNRSATPSGILDSDLDKFAEQCRAWYFNQDEEAGQAMTNTLSTVPPAQRAPYSRIQASVRSLYHRSVNVRKTAEFHAHLSATLPGNSLMPHNRANPDSEGAKKERLDRFERFVRTWATHGMPGTTPFFEALWAVMRLQVLPEALGGAGPHRIEWEMDDAVFKEAAGKDFMHEAVDVLKGVLGFEEKGPSHVPSACPLPSTGSNLRSEPSQPTSISTSGGAKSAAGAPSRPKALRESSDPFLDNPGLSNSVTTSSSRSFTATIATTNTLADGSFAESTGTSTPSSSGPHSPFEEIVPPPSPLRRASYLLKQDASYRNGDLEEEDEAQMRTWTAPDLSNPEFANLCKCFPAFVTRRSLPRFPISPGSALAGGEPGGGGATASGAAGGDVDLEAARALTEGEPPGVESRVRFGTGSMWVGSRARKVGWKGGWWVRFVLWWRRTFC